MRSGLGGLGQGGLGPSGAVAGESVVAARGSGSVVGVLQAVLDPTQLSSRTRIPYIVPCGMSACLLRANP
jgi:hypothetical protein